MRIICSFSIYHNSQARAN